MWVCLLTLPIYIFYGIQTMCNSLIPLTLCLNYNRSPRLTELSFAVWTYTI